MQFSDPIESVQHIYATDTAFAALKAGGSVVAWGDKDWGGDCSKVQAQVDVQAHLRHKLRFCSTEGWGQRGHMGRQ